MLLVMRCASIFGEQNGSMLRTESDKFVFSIDDCLKVFQMVVSYVVGLVCCSFLMTAHSLSDDAINLRHGDTIQIRGVIEQQLKAFRNGKDAKAFGYASPAIQNKFRDPKNFVSMVRRYYPPIYRSRESEFLELENIDGVWVQKVMFVDLDGNIYLALYPMEQQANGEWRIDGCILTVGEGKST